MSNCSGCHYWAGDWSWQRQVRYQDGMSAPCRRHAPTIVGAMGHAIWPRTYPTGGCGDFVARGDGVGAPFGCCLDGEVSTAAAGLTPREEWR